MTKFCVFIVIVEDLHHKGYFFFFSFDTEIKR